MFASINNKNVGSRKWSFLLEFDVGRIGPKSEGLFTGQSDELILHNFKNIQLFGFIIKKKIVTQTTSLQSGVNPMKLFKRLNLEA